MADKLGSPDHAAKTMDFDRYDHVRPIRWQDGTLSLLDQRKLPFAVEYVECTDSDAVAQAIRDLVVRGAPAIGIAAASAWCWRERGWRPPTVRRLCRRWRPRWRACARRARRQ